MANEITIGCSLSYSDSEDTEIELALTSLLASVTTKKAFRVKVSVTTTEVAIGLGGITSLGWFVGVNRDSTNYLQLLTGTGGTAFARLYPGMPALFYIGSGITAPFAIASTAACQMDYLICSA